MHNATRVVVETGKEKTHEFAITVCNTSCISRHPWILYTATRQGGRKANKLAILGNLGQINIAKGWAGSKRRAVLRWYIGGIN